MIYLFSTIGDASAMMTQTARPRKPNSLPTAIHEGTQRATNWRIFRVASCTFVDSSLLVGITETSPMKEYFFRPIVNPIEPLYTLNSHQLYVQRTARGCSQGETDHDNRAIPDRT
jgi:hypothetical protein